MLTGEATTWEGAGITLVQGLRDGKKTFRALSLCTLIFVLKLRKIVENFKGFVSVLYRQFAVTETKHWRADVGRIRCGSMRAMHRK